MPFFLVIALVLVTALSLHAQEATPEPAATAEAASAPADSTPAPEPSPAADTSSPSPTPEASPSGATEGETPATPDASPSDDPDMIPLPPETGDVGAPIVSETEVPALDRPTDSAFTGDLPPGPDVIPDSPAAPTGPSAGEIERKLRIRYQEVRTQVEKDSAVRSLLEKARKAKTSEDERAAYREYYRLLFKKMRAVDKELTARVDVMEAAYLARLAQTRIEPTIPLNPPPVPEPLAN